MNQKYLLDISKQSMSINNTPSPINLGSFYTFILMGLLNDKELFSAALFEIYQLILSSDFTKELKTYAVVTSIVTKLITFKKIIPISTGNRACHSVYSRVQVVWLSGTDFGTQNSPFCSLENYRTSFKPFHKKLNDWVHKNTNREPNGNV